MLPPNIFNSSLGPDGSSDNVQLCTSIPSRSGLGLGDDKSFSTPHS